MKYYYFKSIIRQINGQLKETILVCFFMLLTISLLTISFLISNSDQLERSMIQNTDYRIQIVNDNIFSYHDLNNSTDDELNKFLTYGKSYLLYFVDQLDDLAKQDTLSDYNYNLICSNAIKTNTDQLTVRFLLGVNCTSFTTNENLTITSGRMFTQEELAQSQHKIIIPDTITYYNIGDKIFLYKPISDVENQQLLDENESSQMIEVEIIGKYKADVSTRVSSDQYDFFDNYNYILIPNNTLKEIISSYFNNIRQVYINHIVFNFKDYDDYRSFYEKYKTMLINVNSLTKTVVNIDTNLHNKQQNYEYILYSIQRIKLFYGIIFKVMTTISLFILCWLIYYLLSNKIKEISIFYSLGESKTKLIIRYTIMYAFLLLISLTIGITLGYFISNLLQQKIIDNSSTIQYELLSYSDKNQSAITNSALLEKASINTLINIIIKVSCLSYITLIVSVLIMMLIILKGNIKDKLQKGE